MSCILPAHANSSETRPLDWTASIADPFLITIDQVARFAPIVTFAAWEKFFPCSIDWLLGHSTLRDWLHPAFNMPCPTQGDLYRQWQFDTHHRYYLEIARDDAVRRGQPLHHDQVVAPMYVAAREFDGWLEITYLMLYAHQGAQTFRASKAGGGFDCIVNDFGTHQADLEWITVRVSKNLHHVLGVGYEAHGHVTWYRPGDYLAEGDHPMVMVALNGHACRNGLGTDMVEEIATHRLAHGVTLVDVTTRGSYTGAAWRPSENEGGLLRIGLDQAGEPLGDQVWTKFAGRLGTRSKNALTSATRYDGARLSAAAWAHVWIHATAGLRLGLIPRAYRYGIGPRGPGHIDRAFLRKPPDLRIEHLADDVGALSL